jgi:protein-disulfide isomerase
MGNRVWVLSIGLMLGCMLSARPAIAQDASNAELKKEIMALGDTVKAMQKDLQDIKALLQRAGSPPAPESVVLDVGNNPFKGQKTAPLTMVEFTDYQCPFCGRYARDTYTQIDKEYVATGKIKYVLLDLPLESIHPFAFKAAAAAHCAGEQGKYWEMHDRLFANQQTLDAWNAHAVAVGLDVARFESCLSSDKTAAEIRRDMTQAQVAGITGTPGFFLALTDPTTTKVKTLRSVKGAQPFPAFKAQIDALLAAQEAAAKKH